MATIQGVYVALFGRPADPAGLAYFNTVTKNGADLNAIGNLAGQKEYTDRFDGLNNAQIINTIYQSLFGRDADAAGLEYFAGQLNAGKLTINNIAIAILDGAQGNDKTIVTNKVAAADLFTQALDTAVEVASYTGTAAADAARAFIKGVTTTAATKADADASITKLATAGNTGNTIKLTSNNTDNIVVGTADTNTTDKNDTINANNANDWAPQADKIDAGFGTDTLNATVSELAAPDTTAAANTVARNGAGTVAAGALNNVEILNLTATGTAESFVNVANARQLTQVWNVASADSTVVEAALTVSGLALGTTTVGMKGAIAGQTTFNFANNSGTADAVSLALDGAGATATASGVTIGAIETINVSNTGTSNVDVTAAAAKTINVSGAGNLTIDTVGTPASGGASLQIVETFNASAFTGDLTTNLTGQTALTSVVGGTGVDTITVDTNQTNDLTVSTGAGNDTINVTRDAANGAPVASKSLTLTGGAGNDLFSIAEVGNVRDVTDNANFIKTLVTITDFNGASDVISTSGFGTLDTLNNVERGNITAGTDLLAATTAAAAVTNADQYVRFVYQGDAYLFAQNGTPALDAGDTLIKVTGISDLSAFTTANFIA